MVDSYASTSLRYFNGTDWEYFEPEKNDKALVCYSSGDKDVTGFIPFKAVSMPLDMAKCRSLPSFKYPIECRNKTLLQDMVLFLLSVKYKSSVKNPEIIFSLNLFETRKLLGVLSSYEIKCNSIDGDPDSSGSYQVIVSSPVVSTIFMYGIIPTNWWYAGYSYYSRALDAVGIAEDEYELVKRSNPCITINDMLLYQYFLFFGRTVMTEVSMEEPPKITILRNCFEYTYSANLKISGVCNIVVKDDFGHLFLI